MPTGNDLITQVRDILDEPTPAQFSDAQLIRWLNEGNRDLARRTRALKDAQTIPATAGAYQYFLAENVVAIEHCYYHEAGNGQRFPLIARHLENFDAVRGTDWSREGRPLFFTTQGFAPNLKLVVSPAPVSNVDEFNLLIARLPVELTSGNLAAEIDTPSAWYDALVDYCEFKALRRDRDSRWQEAWQMYQDKRAELVHAPDYHTANREMMPDPVAGYLPSWLVEF